MKVITLKVRYFESGVTACEGKTKLISYGV